MNWGDMKAFLHRAMTDECPPLDMAYRCMRDEAEETGQEQCYECWMEFLETALKSGYGYSDFFPPMNSKHYCKPVGSWR